MTEDQLSVLPCPAWVVTPGGSIKAVTVTEKRPYLSAIGWYATAQGIDRNRLRMHASFEDAVKAAEADIAARHEVLSKSMVKLEKRRLTLQKSIQKAWRTQ